MGKGGKKRGERHSTMIRGGCTMYYCARGGGGGGGGGGGEVSGAL